ncbi:hypothetical protein KUCAC02_014430, partial [Chaenocephalus aceratus]
VYSPPLLYRTQRKKSPPVSPPCFLPHLPSSPSLPQPPLPHPKGTPFPPPPLPTLPDTAPPSASAAFKYTEGLPTVNNQAATDDETQ